jgi:hypothetical protein
MVINVKAKLGDTVRIHIKPQLKALSIDDMNERLAYAFCGRVHPDDMEGNKIIVLSTQQMVDDYNSGGMGMGYGGSDALVEK